MWGSPTMLGCPFDVLCIEGSENRAGDHTLLGSQNLHIVLVGDGEARGRILSAPPKIEGRVEEGLAGAWPWGWSWRG